MALSNTAERYGSVAKTFHWLVALLILTAFPLGVIAENLPADTQEQLQAKAGLFSIHKTVGLTAFFVALARIGWALSQAKPGLLNAGKRLESFLAELVHWLLYASLVIVPLSGWLHHAATEGFAPLLLPFGDSLPLVPKDPAVAHFFGAWHFVFTKVLFASVLLHIVGALKHHVIDRDATLRRMLPGSAVLPDPFPSQGDSHRLPIIVAAVVYAVAIAGGAALGLSSETRQGAQLVAVQSDWAVQDGSLEITVVQMGAEVTGSFADWTAQISFDERVVDGKHGRAEVTIAVGSLTLGSVTTEALGTDFFDASQFTTASFSADILPADGEGAYLAEGTLTIRDVAVPVSMPFSLDLQDDVAVMDGAITLDRRDFEMGKNFPDESSVEFSVAVAVKLTAQRQ